MPIGQAIDTYGYLLFAAAVGFALSDRFGNGLEAVASAFKCGGVILAGCLPLMPELPVLARLTWALASFACCGVILALRYAWLLGAKSVQTDPLTRLCAELMAGNAVSHRR